MKNNQLIIYQTEDGKVKIETHFENETVWLNQVEIGEFFCEWATTRVAPTVAPTVATIVVTIVVTIVATIVDRTFALIFDSTFIPTFVPTLGSTV